MSEYNKKLYKFLLGKCAEYAKHKFNDGDFAEFGCCPGRTGQMLTRVFKRTGCFFDTWSGVPHYDDVDTPSKQHKTNIEKAMKKSKLRAKDKRKRSPMKEFKDLFKEGNLIKYCEFIRGDICKTVPKFMQNQPADRFIFAHIDCNMYLPAHVALFEIWDHLVDGGILYFDDYKDIAWPGIEKAVTEFMGSHSGYAFVDLNPFGVNNCIIIKGNEQDLRPVIDYIIPYLPKI